MPKISACMVVYHEEAIIERCLQSIADVVDEIIVVHDGPCTDNTLNIAQKYGAKTFEQPHGGSSECHRVFSYEQATGEWIFQIDADEYLDPADGPKIRQLVANDEIDAYAVTWPAFDGRNYIPGPFYTASRVCLLRKSHLYFVNITHESPHSYGKVQAVPEITLHHRPGYNNFTFKVLKSKWFRWSRLHAQQIIAKDSAETYNVPDPSQNPTMVYFGNFIKTPFLHTHMKSLRMLVSQLRYYIKYPRHMLYGMNWRILIFNIVNYYYLAFQVAKLKKSEVKSA